MGPDLPLKMGPCSYAVVRFSALAYGAKEENQPFRGVLKGRRFLTYGQGSGLGGSILWQRKSTRREERKCVPRGRTLDDQPGAVNTTN